MMNIIPMGDRLVVELFEVKYEGNLEIPEIAKEAPQIGTVLAVGTDNELKEWIKEGDKIIFGKFAGQPFFLDQKAKVLILRKDEIMGKLQEDK